MAEAPGKRAQRRLVREIERFLQGRIGQQAVQRATVEMVPAELPGKGLADGALARTTGSVNGNHRNACLCVVGVHQATTVTGPRSAVPRDSPDRRNRGTRYSHWHNPKSRYLRVRAVPPWQTPWQCGDHYRCQLWHPLASRP